MNVYKIFVSGWKDTVNIGDEWIDVNGTDIVIISILKVECNEGDLHLVVTGTETSKIRHL